MKNQYSLYDLLIIIGIIQGVITSILLIISKKNKRSNKFLALTLISFSFLTSKTLLHTLHLWDTTIFRFFPNGIELALPPLIYFYVIHLIKPKFRFTSYNWLHFVPFFIAQTYAFIVYFSVVFTDNLKEKDIIAKSLWFHEVKQIEEYLLMVFLIFYLYFGFKEVTSYKKWLNQTTSDSTYPDFNWLITLFRLFIIISLIKLINHLLDIFFDFNSSLSFRWDFLILIIAGLIYFLGLKGLLQPNYSFNRENENIKNNLDPTFIDSKIQNTIKLIQKVMKEDKVFLNPKLTIYELSNVLGIPERAISVAINQHFDISFRKFINNYRVEEVKSKLIDSNYSHMSILGIALESGFNSEASFYRIFKKHTDLSPKEFIQKSKV